MAPESFRGDAQPASDLYGLGATLLFLLSGKLKMCAQIFVGTQKVSAAGHALHSCLVGQGAASWDAFAGAQGSKPAVFLSSRCHEPASAGKSPSSFPQARMRIDYSSSGLQVSENLDDLLEGLLEPLVEDRLSAEDALLLLSEEPARRSPARQALQ